MPLQSIKKELTRAQSGKYALPLFDTFDMQSTEGMLAAVTTQRAPAMIATYSSHFDRPEGRALVAYIQARARNIPTPISLMLDHGSSLEQCIQAIKLGFSDVMFDGSAMPLEENIAQTRTVVRAAHAVGVAVEAELGHVGSGSDYQSFGAQRKGFTNPDTVKHFVAETGVDMLAIAIGTAHGLYEGEPNLDLDLLRAIRAQVDIPLALHGGSGCSEDQFRAVIKGGIAKINVATDLYQTAGQHLVTAVQESQEEGRAAYFALGKIAAQSIETRCAYYLDLFGASGKVAT
jgi:fructose-bisphosphate aldolase class II